MGAAWPVYVCVCILTKIVRFGQVQHMDDEQSVYRLQQKCKQLLSENSRIRDDFSEMKSLLTEIDAVRHATQAELVALRRTQGTPADPVQATLAVGMADLKENFQRTQRELLDAKERDRDGVQHIHSLTQEIESMHTLNQQLLAMHQQQEGPQIASEGERQLSERQEQAQRECELAARMLQRDLEATRARADTLAAQLAECRRREEQGVARARELERELNLQAEAHCERLRAARGRHQGAAIAQSWQRSATKSVQGKAQAQLREAEAKLRAEEEAKAQEEAARHKAAEKRRREQEEQRRRREQEWDGLRAALLHERELVQQGVSRVQGLEEELLLERRAHGGTHDAAAVAASGLRAAGKWKGAVAAKVGEQQRAREGGQRARLEDALRQLAELQVGTGTTTGCTALATHCTAPHG